MQKTCPIIFCSSSSLSSVFLFFLAFESYNFEFAIVYLRVCGGCYFFVRTFLKWSILTTREFIRFLCCPYITHYVQRILFYVYHSFVLFFVWSISKITCNYGVGLTLKRGKRAKSRNQPTIFFVEHTPFSIHPSNIVNWNSKQGLKWSVCKFHLIFVQLKNVVLRPWNSIAKLKRKTLLILCRHVKSPLLSSASKSFIISWFKGQKRITTM